MKRSPYIICLYILLLLVTAAIPLAAATLSYSSDSGENSVFFETNPNGAEIWLNGEYVGTSSITYYTDRDGTFNVVVKKPGYEDYEGHVTVVKGQRAHFYSLLTPLTSTADTVATIGKTPVKLPTPFQTTSPLTSSNYTLYSDSIFVYNVIGLLIICLIGFGILYVMYRILKWCSDPHENQSPTDTDPSEIPTPDRSEPPQSTQESIHDYKWKDLVSTCRKGQQLTIFAKSMEQLCDKANEQWIQGNTAEAQRLHFNAVKEFYLLKDFEESFSLWKKAGYNLSIIEDLKEQNNLDVIHSTFKDYEGRVFLLEKVGKNLQKLNRQYPVEFRNPEIQKAVELFKAELKNPLQISDIDRHFEIIREKIEEISRVNLQWDQRIQTQTQLLRSNYENLKGLGIDISTFLTKAISQDSDQTENDLKKMAEAGYSAINNEMNRMENQGVHVVRSTDEIRNLIDDKNYAWAIIACGKKMSEITALRESLSKAIQLKNKLGRSPIVALFDNGNYEQFLTEGNKILDLIYQCTRLSVEAKLLGNIPENIPKEFQSLNEEQLISTISALQKFIQDIKEIKNTRLSFQGLYEKAKLLGKIPEGIPTNIDKLDNQSLVHVISKMETYVQTAKPNLYSIRGIQQESPSKLKGMQMLTVLISHSHKILKQRG